MKRAILATLAVLLLGAQDCEPPKPETFPEGGTAFCHGREYTIFDKIAMALDRTWNTIIGGEESSDRRATVQVFFGQGYCSGVALSPHTVLTAGHCGYGASTAHTIKVDGVSYPSRAEQKLVHPEYLIYANDPANLEARKADLMLLFTDEEMPGPYIDPGTHIYHSSMATNCFGLIAQGFGRAENPKPTEQLRESDYLITQEQDKLIVSRATDAGKICFGDSGGPLYADVNTADGHQLYLAGITTTTMSTDCLLGGSHVKASYPPFASWIATNTVP